MFQSITIRLDKVEIGMAKVHICMEDNEPMEAEMTNPTNSTQASLWRIVPFKPHAWDAMDRVDPEISVESVLNEIAFADWQESEMEGMNQ
jgi:hypothetical protein